MPRSAWKRRLLRLAFVVAALYLVVLVIFKSFENSLVYHPTTDAGGWLKSPERVEDVWFDSPAGDRIHAWWLPSETPTANSAILICHGNGGNLSHRGRMMADLMAATQSSVLIFDYPGYGKSSGQPTEAGCYDAGGAALKWLAEKGVPSANVVLLGESLGGGVATELAARSGCRALALVKTFTSLPAVAKWHYPWLPAHWLMSNRFDTASKLPNLACPVFVAHGTADRVVPFAHGEKLFTIANAPKRFLRLEGQDHNAWLTAEFHAALADFLRQRAPLR